MLRNSLIALAFFAVPLSTSAADLTDLLKEGFEIKATSVLPMGAGQSQLELVLQKGEQAALCEALNEPWGYTHSTACDLFHKYGKPQN